MKQLDIIVGTALIATLAIVPAFAQSPRPAARATLAQIAWLAGPWRGVLGPVSLDERWTDAAGGVMLAVSRTLNGTRLESFEFLRIVERNGGLVYIAQPGGRPPTEFSLTAIAGEAATFENPAHDFPKVIRYVRKNDTLEVTIGDGASKSETFTFNRVR